MNVKTLLLTFVSFISFGCNTVSVSENVEPNVSTNYVYYEINGETENELRYQMDQLGPVDQKRSQHDAYTAWYVDWDYPYVETDGTCTPGAITVTVTITQTFPKWNMPSETSQNLRERWNTYLIALQIHEDGHKQVGVDAGTEILQALNELSGYPTCSELEQTADMTGQAVLERFRQKEIVYDQMTRHGQTQGAYFP